MSIVKKFVFAIPFLAFLTLFYQTLPAFLENIYLIFDFNQEILIKLVAFLIFLLLSSLCFVVLVVLSFNWWLVLPVALIGSFLALPFFSPPSLYVVVSGSFLVFLITYLTLSQKMASYLTFKPTVLLIPSVNQTVTLLLLVVSIALYFSADLKIKQEGFKIPDSLIETSLRLVGQGNLSGSKEQLPNQETQPTLPQISPEQLIMLKQNPALLKQFGLTPEMLDQLTAPTKSGQLPKNSPQATPDVVKIMLQKQLQDLLNPYLQWLPLVLAGLFFLSLKWIVSLLSLTLYPLVWSIFWIFEKTGFIKFEVEMREVKKLVV